MVEAVVTLLLTELETVKVYSQVTRGILWYCQFDALFVALSVTEVQSSGMSLVHGVYMLVLMRIHFTLWELVPFQYIC